MRLPLWRTKSRHLSSEAQDAPPAPSPSLSESDHSEALHALDCEHKKLAKAEEVRDQVGKKVGWLRREREKNHFGPAIAELVVKRGKH